MSTSSTLSAGLLSAALLSTIVAASARADEPAVPPPAAAGPTDPAAPAPADPPPTAGPPPASPGQIEGGAPFPLLHKPPASLALPKGKLNLTLTVEIETTKAKVAEPVSIAPDVAYGVTDAVTVSVVHSKFATTGFRAAVGGGLCFHSDAACPQIYNNVGAEALVALTRGPLATAVIGGVHAMNLDGGFYDAKLGLRARYAAGKLAVIASPSVFFAATKREDAMGARLNKDLLYLPVLVTAKLTPQLTLGLGSGVKTLNLSDFGKTWEVPLGAVATYAVDRRLTLGASFVFGKLIGGAGDAATGPDFRGTQIWAVFAP